MKTDKAIAILILTIIAGYVIYVHYTPKLTENEGGIFTIIGLVLGWFIFYPTAACSDKLGWGPALIGVALMTTGITAALNFSEGLSLLTAHHLPTRLIPVLLLGISVCSFGAAIPLLFINQPSLVEKTAPA